MTGTYCVIGSYFSRNYGYVAARFFEIEPAAYPSDVRGTILKATPVNRDLLPMEIRARRNNLITPFTPEKFVALWKGREITSSDDDAFRCVRVLR